MTQSGRQFGALLGVLAASVTLAACGSSSSKSSSGGQAGTTKASSDPQTLLRQTFAANHQVKSGVLHFDLVVDPQGSSIVSGPLSLSLSGPFESGAKGQTPESDLTIVASGLGKKGTFGVVTTKNAAYVRLEGAAYALPQSTVSQLHRSLASGSGSSGTLSLSSLGIDPERWLTNPKIIGTETVNGASTEHLRAGVNVTAMLADVNRLLAKESKVTSKAGVSDQIPPATAQKIAAAVRNPTVDLWTGKDDSTLRKLTLSLSVPVTGQASTRLGGMTSASFRLDAGYSNLNESQTISAPSNARSFTALQAKLQQIGQQLGGALAGLGAGSTAGSTGGSGQSSVPSSSATQKYARCINAANNDVTKMQKCASLLNGK